MGARMSEVCVVHLVWAPYGPELLRRFLASLRAVPAGCEHELLVVFNGFPGEVGEEFLGELAGVPHRALVLPEPVLDLAAYRAALDATQAGVVCFTNSYAEALVESWLATLVGALGPDIGLAGASGSWESAFSSAPLELRVQRFLEFPRFPNPHLRTNAFLGRRELLLQLAWDGVDSKLGALVLESGRRSLTRQVRRLGLRTVVVGRDGRLVEPGEWAHSATFRSGDQGQLLVSDNRTRDYAQAGPAERRRLARMAWGRCAPVAY